MRGVAAEAEVHGAGGARGDLIESAPTERDHDGYGGLRMSYQRPRSIRILKSVERDAHPVDDREHATDEGVEAGRESQGASREPYRPAGGLRAAGGGDDPRNQSQRAREGMLRVVPQAPSQSVDAQPSELPVRDGVDVHVGDRRDRF